MINDKLYEGFNIKEYEDVVAINNLKIPKESYVRLSKSIADAVEILGGEEVAIGTATSFMIEKGMYMHYIKHNNPGSSIRFYTFPDQRLEDRESNLLTVGVFKSGQTGAASGYENAAIYLNLYMFEKNAFYKKLHNALMDLVLKP